MNSRSIERRKKNQRLARRAAIGAGALVCTYIVAAASTHLYVRYVLIPEIRTSAGDLARFEPLILADLKLLNDKPIYQELPREKNAERLISGFIGWDGADPLVTPEHDRLVEMMKTHEHALLTDDDWSDFLDDEKLEQMDLAWVDQLAAYDHIDFATHPAYNDAVNQAAYAPGVARVKLVANLPFPALSELRFAAMARVAQLHLEDRNEEAQILYRHIAYLFSTTDSIIGSMVSVAMLESEKQLADRTELDWPLIDDSRRLAMKRTAWAWIGIANIKARGGSLEAFQPYFKRPLNACAGMLETFDVETLLQDYLRPTAFLEVDLIERLAKQAKFKQELFRSCGHGSLDAFFAPVNESPLMLGRLEPNPARIPFLRRVLGLRLLVETSPNYFKLYEQNPREPASK